MKWIDENKTYRTDNWMETALYHPQKGYYRTRKKEPGASGDFHTPIHLSNILAKMISIEFEKKNYKKIVEFGGGDGYFANQILQLKKIEKYTIVDWPNSESKNTETVKPEEYFQKGKQEKTLILGIEFLDSFPSRRFKFKKEWLEEYWFYENRKWTNKWKKIEKINNFLQEIQNPKEDKIIEFHPFLEKFLKKLKKSFKKSSFIFLDYGKNEIYGDSLRGFISHKQILPFSKPGETDWTTHVRWKRFEHLAKKHDLKNLEIKTLTNFSLDKLEKIFQEDDSYKNRMSAKELISPFGMGEVFQVATGDI